MAIETYLLLSLIELHFPMFKISIAIFSTWLKLLNALSHSANYLQLQLLLLLLLTSLELWLCLMLLKICPSVIDTVAIRPTWRELALSFTRTRIALKPILRL